MPGEAILALLYRIPTAAPIHGLREAVESTLLRMRLSVALFLVVLLPRLLLLFLSLSWP
jgi:hypothetical protein